MTDAGIRLDAEAVAEAFPFHFAVDAALRLLQFGPSLLRLDPRLVRGADLDQFFEVIRPKGPVSQELRRGGVKLPVLMEHRKSGIRFRGQFVDAGPQTWLFVGSPWFETAEALEASGLALSDFAPHDPITDLLMMGRTRQMALQDLKLIADRLEAQHAELARTEDLYRRAISAASAVPYRENLETGSFDFIGEGIVEITGVPAGDMTPAALDGMVVETSEAPVQETTLRQQVPVEGHRRRDLRIRASNGRLCWLSDSSVAAFDESGRVTGRIGILFDITERKRREELLQASEARASQLAEVVSRTKNAVLVTDADRRILWANPAFEVIAGEGVNDMQGKRALDLFSVKEPESRIKGLLSMLDAGQPVVTEIGITNRLGQDFNFVMEWQPVMDARGLRTRWMMVANDVTELRKAQELLREREEEARRLAMVAARTDNAVVLTDAQTRIEWVNEGFTRMTGYTLDEVRGKVPGHVLQCPETDPETVRMIRERLGARQGFRCEIQNRRKDGRLYWAAIEVQPILNDSGQDTAYMAIESDITARKRYEERLRQLSTELETILALSPDGYAMFDARGRMSYCNSAFGRMLGTGQETVRGLGYEEVDRLFGAACVSPPTPIGSLEPGSGDRIVLKGSRGTALTRSVISIADGQGAQRGKILFLHDVTREEELQQIQSDFLATAAHELRTPMTSVQGFSELLLEDSLDPATARDIAATIHRQSSVLVGMVNELLDLQRIEQRRGRDFDRRVQPLQPIIRRTVSQLKVAGDSRVVSLEGLPDDPVQASVDAAQLGQALTNVLNNAYKYSPGGGEISLSLESRVHQGVAQAGIRVRDHGIGMTLAQQSRVFERFYRADPSGSIPGTGLGMSLVKQIAELHDGQVDVDSLEGLGTTVTLWLPVSLGIPASEQW